MLPSRASSPATNVLDVRLKVWSTYAGPTARTLPLVGDPPDDEPVLVPVPPLATPAARLCITQLGLDGVPPGCGRAARGERGRAAGVRPAGHGRAGGGRQRRPRVRLRARRGRG